MQQPPGVWGAHLQKQQAAREICGDLFTTVHCNAITHRGNARRLLHAAPVFVVRAAGLREIREDDFRSVRTFSRCGFCNLANALCRSALHNTAVRTSGPMYCGNRAPRRIPSSRCVGCRTGRKQVAQNQYTFHDERVLRSLTGQAFPAVSQAAAQRSICSCRLAVS